MFPPLTLHPFPFCETAMELYFWSGWKTQSTSLFRVTTKVFIEGSRLQHVLNCTCNCYTTYCKVFLFTLCCLSRPQRMFLNSISYCFCGKAFSLKKKTLKVFEYNSTLRQKLQTRSIFKLLQLFTEGLIDNVYSDSTRTVHPAPDQCH